MTAKEETNAKFTELSDDELENVNGGTDLPLSSPQTSSKNIVLNSQQSGSSSLVVD